jgi:hypothetical protein
MALATKLAPPFFAGSVLRLSIHSTWTFSLSTLLKNNGLLKPEVNSLILTDKKTHFEFRRQIGKWWSRGGSNS